MKISSAVSILSGSHALFRAPKGKYTSLHFLIQGSRVRIRLLSHFFSPRMANFSKMTVKLIKKLPAFQKFLKILTKNRNLKKAVRGRWETNEIIINMGLLLLNNIGHDANGNKINGRHPQRRLQAINKFICRWTQANVHSGKGHRVCERVTHQLTNYNDSFQRPQCAFFDPDVKHGGPNPDECKY